MLIHFNSLSCFKRSILNKVQKLIGNNKKVDNHIEVDLPYWFTRVHKFHS